MTEEVIIGGELFAIILRASFREPGVHFFTPGHFSQQLGYMSHPAGHRIRPHVHREVRREVFRTQEVLVIRSGRLRVDFYSDAAELLESILDRLFAVTVEGAEQPPNTRRNREEDRNRRQHGSAWNGNGNGKQRGTKVAD